MEKIDNNSKTVNLLGTECLLEFAYYPNNTVAITAYTNSDKDSWCVPTVNWEQNYHDKQEYAERFKFPLIVVKNYGENEGVFEDLVKGGVIEPGFYLSGSDLTVQIGWLTSFWQEIAKKHLGIK